MEKFTTRLTESYNLRQEVFELVKNYVIDEEEDIFRIDVEPDKFVVSFKPKFGSGLDSVEPMSNAYKSIVEIAKSGGYNSIQTLNIEDIFTVKFKKIY